MSRLRPLGLLSLALSVVLLGCAGPPGRVSPPAAGVRAGPVAVKTPEMVSAELKTPAAVSSEERMQTYPSSGEYVAFSLSVSQKLIATVDAGRNYRVVYPQVFNLGGINQIVGLVYDRQAQDLILVGRYEPDWQPLTLDDLAVALRARFIHNTWPLVSIDPTAETKRTEMQRVRFEGGIEDTQFGADLLQADYRLKQMGMGLLPPGVPRLKTYWDLGRERAQEGTDSSYKIRSRFWFYPVLPSVSVREDVVAIKGLEVGVFTEVLAAEVNGTPIKDLSTFRDVVGDQFAKAVSEQFAALARVHPSFSRVQGLDELVALTKGIEEMEEQVDLAFWLRVYQVKQMKTPREVKVLKREEKYEAQSPVGDRVYRGYQELSGGVRLMAIALRLKAGDVSALKEAVLKTRPKSEALSWSFVVGEWLIPTFPGMLTSEDIVPLFTQAVFFQAKGFYDDAITVYGKIIELKPDWDNAYSHRGIAYASKGQHDQAIEDFNQALKINPGSAEIYYSRGLTLAQKGQHDQAIGDYTRAIELNPKIADAYNDRGLGYAAKGQHDQAMADYDRAIDLAPKDVKAYINRGAVYADKGQHDQAIAAFNEALKINPELAEAYYNRGLVHARKGQHDQAMADSDRAIELNPRYAKAYTNRGIVYARRGHADRAIADFNQALEIDPQLPEAYGNRGIAYALKGQYDQAISDLNRALEINPRLPKFSAVRDEVEKLKKAGIYPLTQIRSDRGVLVPIGGLGVRALLGFILQAFGQALEQRSLEALGWMR